MQVLCSFYRIFLYKIPDIKRITNLIVLINLILTSLKGILHCINIVSHKII